MEEVKPVEENPPVGQQAQDDASIKAEMQLLDLQREFTAVMKRYGILTGLCILELKDGVILEVDHQATVARKLGLISFSKQLIDAKVQLQAKKIFAQTQAVEP